VRERKGDFAELKDQRPCERMPRVKELRIADNDQQSSEDDAFTNRAGDNPSDGFFECAVDSYVVLLSVCVVKTPEINKVRERKLRR
jgi:hypothetical protein